MSDSACQQRCDLFIYLEKYDVDISSMARRCALAGLALFGLALCNAPGAAPLQAEPDWSAGGHLHINRSIDSQKAINLQQLLSLDIDGGHTVSLRGVVSSLMPPAQDGLIKDGDGRLELWGDNRNLNNYVHLRAGTLHLAGRYPMGNDIWAQLHAYRGSTLSYEAGAVVATTLILENTPPPAPGQDAIYWRVDHGVATQIGPILGHTPLVKTGSGTLRLQDGSHSINSRLSIAQGGVELNTIFAGLIDVQNNAVLAGNGQAGNLTIARGGILAPAGRLRVRDALQFQGDSQFHVRAWADGGLDSVDVLFGTAALDGHVIVLPQGQADDWQDPVSGVIVQARDGLGASRFASVSSALPYLEPELKYDENTVTLMLRPRQGLPDEPNLPEGVSSGWAASLRNMLAEDSRFLREAVYARAGNGNRHYYSDYDGEPGTQNSHAARHNVWFQTFHSSGRHRDTRMNGELDRRINGFLAGADREFGDSWRLGIYGGGSRTQANHRTSRASRQNGGDANGADRNAVPGGPAATVESAHLGLYTHHSTAWGSQLSMGMAQSWHHVSSRRSAITPGLHNDLSSRYRVYTSQVFSQVQHPMWISSDLSTTVTPFARLAWVNTKHDGHTEDGGLLALHFPPDSTTVLFSTLGLRAEHKLALPQGQARISGSFAWRHANGDTGTDTKQYFRDDVMRNTMIAPGIAVASQAWQLQLGIEAEISKHAQLGLHYAGQYGKRLQDHGVRLGMGVRW